MFEGLPLPEPSFEGILVFIIVFLLSILGLCMNLRRVAGNIAEEVQAAGGEPFVTFGEDGRTESVTYDRLAMARTAVLKRQHEQLRFEFEQFKHEVTQRLALEVA